MNIEIVPQTVEILSFYGDPTLVELAGRTCYKSEDKITDNSADGFIERLIRLGHESVLEHSGMTVRFITNRAITHELVRHRIASYSQESTRFCAYKNKPIQFIQPVWLQNITGIYGTHHKPKLEHAAFIFIDNCLNAADDYLELLEIGNAPQFARDVLPNSLKTEIVMTTNVRSWRNVFNLRLSKAAHPQIRDLMFQLVFKLKDSKHYIFYKDIVEKIND